MNVGSAVNKLKHAANVLDHALSTNAITKDQYNSAKGHVNNIAKDVDALKHAGFFHALELSAELAAEFVELGVQFGVIGLEL